MRNRLRRLHLDGHPYTWTATIRCVPGETDCFRGIRLRVWGAGKNGCTLYADLISKSTPGPWGACATDDAYPTASDVRSVITYALTQGWQPTTIGGTFPLTEQAHATTFELDAFHLTDQPSKPA